MDLNYITMIVVIGGFAAALKVIEFLVPKRSMLVQKEQQILRDLHLWHSRTDEDGRMLWYHPRGVHEQNEKMMEVLRDISASQKDTAKILERILEKLDK